jgi:hypothetical protein
MTRTPTASSPARPRKRRNATEWAGLLARWRESGLELDDFARRHRVPGRSLRWWRWRLESGARSAREPGLDFVPVVAAAAEGQPAAAAPAGLRWAWVTDAGARIEVTGPPALVVEALLAVVHHARR